MPSKGCCISPKIRLMSHIQKIDNGCWQWTASMKRDGYGAFAMGRKIVAAHRASYIIHNGEIPAGMVVRHECDNPSCVNPEHLILGTHEDNMNDAARRGRMKWKADHRSVSDDEKSRIKSLAQQGRSVRSLVAESGMKRTTVRKILKD